MEHELINVSIPESSSDRSHILHQQNRISINVYLTFHALDEHSNRYWDMEESEKSRCDLTVEKVVLPKCMYNRHVSFDIVQKVPILHL